MLTRLNRLYLIIKTTQNWLGVLSIWFQLKDKCVANFRNGYKFKLDRKSWSEYIRRIYLFSYFPTAKLYDKENKFIFLYHSRKLEFNFGKWGFDTVLEIFGGDPYKDFLKFAPVKNKQVVDIGSAFGDTAIYFLIKGAKYVYAYEAFPGFFHLAKENLRTNGFSDSCVLVLAAVSGKSGTMMIDSKMDDMFGTGIKEPIFGEKVPIITLRQIVEQNNIQDGFLKIDTEGYEYEILLNTPKEILRRFSDMLIEYHYGFEKLEPYIKGAGFEIFHTGPTHVYVPQYASDENRNMYVGYITAKRK